MTLKRWLAVGDLTVAAAFWGFGFIATVWALRVLNAFEITLLRFLLAGAVGLPFLFLRASLRDLASNFKLSLWPAVFLWATLVFQTWGLNYTTATKSGFITTLYVVMVPILDSVFSRRRISWRLWSFIVLAFLGTGFILNAGLSALNIGDILTLVCAVFAAAQIYWVGVISPRIRTPFAFNISQCLWCILLAAPFCLIPDGGQGFWLKLEGAGQWPIEAWAGLISLGLGSTVIAFFLQIRGQAGVSPTVGSMLCLLESPFAMLFAFVALAHIPDGWELTGAFLIFLAAIGASLNDAPRAKAEQVT